MRVGFTGTREGMSRYQASQCQSVLALLKKASPNAAMFAPEFHYGTHERATLLADEEAAKLAEALGFSRMPHYAMAGEELGRNREIVAVVSILIAAPLTDKEELRSGTWATVRYARERHMPVVMLCRDEPVYYEGEKSKMAKVKRQKAQSWRPRRGIDTVRGVETYCSPACGGNCTLKAYHDATSAAKKLAARLGAGWKPRVWENMGWFYRVERGPLTVNPTRYGKQPRYSCLMNSEPSPSAGGSILWFDRDYYRTPEAAVNAQLRLARSVIKRLQATIAAAEGGGK